MIAVVLLAIAAGLAVGAPAGGQLQRLGAVGRGRRPARWLVPAGLLGAATVAVGVILGLTALGWLLAAGIVVATTLWVLRAARADRKERRFSAETARATRTLALLLEAGQIKGAALADASADSPVLASVALTDQLGGDVAAAFDELGARLGCSGFRRVSAAWQVSEQTGAPMALVLSRVAENLRQERHLAAVVAAELAAARASGRIMALLPFIAIGMGTLVGADPLTFLFGSGPGEVALLAGIFLAASGVVWTEHIARVKNSTSAARP